MEFENELKKNELKILDANFILPKFTKIV